MRPPGALREGSTGMVMGARRELPQRMLRPREEDRCHARIDTGAAPDTGTRARPPRKSEICFGRMGLGSGFSIPDV